MVIKEKLKKVLTAGTQLSLHLSHAALAVEDVIARTQSQLNKLKKHTKLAKA